MPSNLHRTAAVLSLTIFLHHLLAAGVSQAQSPPDGNTTTTTTNNNNNNNNYFTSAKFNPSMAIIIVVLISAFFFLGFFSIYIRQCGGGGGIAGGRLDALAAVAVGGRSRRQRGLDPTVLETFPTLIYSQVKEHKIGKGALECAICLNEFEDDDSIRLLPKCDHVFHQDCIDAWLSTHVTCPVCRTNYADDTAVSPPATAAADPTPASEAAAGDSAPSRDDVAIAVDDEGERERERERERKELDRIASRVRRSGSRRQRNLPRSHSTGHSVTLRGEGLERFTLRLPESVRKDIIAAGMLRRERSLGRVGEESSRRGRSVRLGRSDRWPSVFVRSLSARIPAWGNWRRGGDEGSVKEGSAKGRFAGGGSVRPNASGGDSESSTAALNRV